MPAYKENKCKDTEYYVHKNLYFDRKNPYQAECMELMNICGRRQAKLLGLMAHEFIINHGINLDNVSKEQFTTYMKLLELHPQDSISSIPSLLGNNLKNNNTSSISNMVHSGKTEDNKNQEESFMDEDDMKEMNNALAAWGI